VGAVPSDSEARPERGRGSIPESPVGVAGGTASGGRVRTQAAACPAAGVGELPVGPRWAWARR
jgi:hypothetical protein